MSKKSYNLINQPHGKLKEMETVSDFQKRFKLIEKENKALRGILIEVRDLAWKRVYPQVHDLICAKLKDMNKLEAKG